MAWKILAADKDPRVVEQICDALEKQGYAVVTACDGLRALELIASEKPDLLVIDATLPLGDGFEVLKKVRAAPATHPLLVVMTTEWMEEGDVFRAWHHGVDTFQSKVNGITPVFLAELCVKIKILFKNSSSYSF